MADAIILEEQIEIPMSLRSLAEFRDWTATDAFPERGRIDYLAGRIEVDMSPEDLHTHGKPRTEIVGVVGRRVKNLHLGELYTVRARVSNLEANLSAEPDLVFVSDASLNRGRVRLIPRAAGVTEFWLIDARAADLVFRIHRRGATAYEPADSDPQGHQYSAVLDAWYRLDRSRNEFGRICFDLRERGTPAR